MSVVPLYCTVVLPRIIWIIEVWSSGTDFSLSHFSLALFKMQLQLFVCLNPVNSVQHTLELLTIHNIHLLWLQTTEKRDQKVFGELHDFYFIFTSRWDAERTACSELFCLWLNDPTGRDFGLSVGQLEKNDSDLTQCGYAEQYAHWLSVSWQPVS